MKRGLAGILLFGAFCLQAQDSVSTVAGQALRPGADNGPGASALFNDPAAVVANAAGHLFVADSQNHVIRRIATNGLVSTFAGAAGLSGSDNGSGAQARFDTPSGIAVAPNGDFYVSDTGNHTIRRITSAGVVTTVAGGVGQSGFADGLRTAARFNSPLGLAVAADGTVLVADTGNQLIRALAPSGALSTLAGRAESWGYQDGLGENARFHGPVGLAVDARGDLFVSDSNNHVIRRLTRAGLVTTWAGVPGIDGFTDGDRWHARFSQPAELAFDQHGNLLVADSFNHVIRQIDPEGNVSIVTGLARVEGSAEGSNGQARLFNPYGVAFCPDGSLVVTDAYNQLIRVVLVPFKMRIHFAESQVSLRWPSVIGKKYQVQHQSAAEGGPWINWNVPIKATNLDTTLADETVAMPRSRLYRAVVVP